MSDETVSLFPIRHTNLLALVIATFILLDSLRNPTSFLLFDLTMLIMIHSFSLPWNPSTVETSISGNFSLSFETYALYGAIIPISSFETPKFINSSAITYTKPTSPSLYLDFYKSIEISNSSYSSSYISVPAVSI